MKNLITNNPFRILGVYSNSSTKEITANKGRIMAFAKVGKSTDFPSDLSSLLPTPTRTVESVDAALSNINLPADKIKYALFWFVNSSPIDDMALKHIQVSNIDKAFEIFGKKTTYSSLLNKGVYSFINDEKQTAIECFTKVIHEDNYRSEFIEAICGTTFTISEDDLAKLFIDELLTIHDASDLIKSFPKSSADSEYLKVLAIQKPIAIINAEINKAKNCGNSANAEYEAGITLIKYTEPALELLEANLSTDDLQYQTTVDALARQILQCGINYYNASDDVDKALALQGYAQKIAVSKLLKDRCAENVGILKQKKEFGVVGPAIEQVKNELESFGSRTVSISTVKGFVQRCTPNLIIIGSKLGSDDKLFIKISTAVVHNALGMLVDVINRKQENQLSVFDGTLKSSIDSAIDIINDLKTLKMDSQCLSRLSQNEQTLNSLQSQLNKLSTTSPVQTYRRPTQTKNYESHQSTQTKSFFEENTGCVIWLIIGLVVAIIASLS